jgi:hypothetical protein
MTIARSRKILFLVGLLFVSCTLARAGSITLTFESLTEGDIA